MVGAQDASAVFEILLIQNDCLLEPAHLLVSASEVVAEGESSGVAGPENAFRILEVLLIQNDCLLEPAHLLESASEIIA